MPRMIPVRSRISGLETTVNEAAYGHFAADYQRLDEPADPPGKAEAPKNDRRSTAASKEKE